MILNRHFDSDLLAYHDQESNGSFVNVSGSNMDEARHEAAIKNGGENLMLRKTQGDLLQKLRQLRQWQQQQQEHLLQDKEKKLSLIREQEKKLQAVQDYQRRILAQSGNFGSSPNVNVIAEQHPVGNKSLFHMQTHGRDFQEIPAARQSVGLQQGRLDPNGNVMPTSNLAFTGLMPPPKTVLLSPKHFQISTLPHKADDLDTMNSPDENTRPLNPMLLTQKIHLPVSSDEELSQFTESDSSSIGHIDGVRPIEDTPSEASLDDDNLSDSHPLNKLNENDELDNDGDGVVDDDDGESDKDDTLVEKEREDEQTHMNKEEFEPSFDDVPIKPGAGSQTKTFEERLDEQLKLEDHKDPVTQIVQEPKVPVKRPFLRKGDGIARFGYNRKKGTVSKSNQNQKGNKKGPVTRKTATSKQSSNTAQGSVLQELNLFQEMGTTPSHLSFGGFGVPVCVEEGKATSLAPVIEDSFQERMKQWDEVDVVEKAELNEFELLEEAAANCSLSSNSSTVLRILSQKKAQAELDKNNNLTATVPEWRNIGKDTNENMEVEDDVNTTLTEDKSEDEGEDTLKAVDNVRFCSTVGLSNCFDDSKSWKDHGVLDSSEVHDDLMVSLNTSTPEDKSHMKISRASLRKSPQVSSTPPTSALVTKLFPQLKIKNNEEVKSDEPGKRKQSPKQNTIQANEPLSTGTTQSGKTTDSRDGATENTMSSAVREKLQELENEIKKYREDNATLHRLREEREKDLQELQREKSLFESQKSEELEKLEKFRAEEERRLRRDKRIFEQYQKASRALPDKKEREEITILKTKMNELQDDMKLRESRWSAAASRYKDRIANLEKENKEMKEEVKLLEKQNLEVQRKDQLKTRELQQLKAFEKRKLSKPEELQVKSASINSASKPTTGKDEHFIKENEKQKTPPNTPPAVHQEPQKQAKVNSDKCLTHVEKRDMPVAEKHPPKEHSSLRDTQKVQNTTKSDTCSEAKESSNITQVVLQEPSPPSAKKANSLRSVRFKDDDDSKQDSQPQLLPKKICHNDGKREVINPDGSRVVMFSNGTRKEISADGVSVIVTFFNGDVKQIMSDERVVYYYAEAQTTHTTYPDGMQVLQFPSNQIEKHYPDGTKEIIFPDQTVKYLYQSGAEECVFADGTVERISEDGSRIVEFPNGQRETYTKLFKKREFPDGTVKTVYTDGRQETRYPSGRLRVKDGEGRLLVDTADEKQSTL